MHGSHAKGMMGCYRLSLLPPAADILLKKRLLLTLAKLARVPESRTAVGTAVLQYFIEAQHLLGKRLPYGNLTLGLTEVPQYDTVTPQSRPQF